MAKDKAKDVVDLDPPPYASTPHLLALVRSGQINKATYRDIDETKSMAERKRKLEALVKP